MNVYQVEIRHIALDSRRRSVYVLAASLEDAVAKGYEYLKDDYSAVPDELEDWLLTGAQFVMEIAWPKDPE